MAFNPDNPLPPSDEQLQSLFQMEIDHMPSKTYLQILNSEGSHHLSARLGIVSSFIGFSPFFSYLAITYFDRFLSVHTMPDGDSLLLKLAAFSCISLTLKVMKIEYPISSLMQDEEFIFDSKMIQKMEKIILGVLRGQTRSADPFCFLNYFITFLNLKKNSSIQELKNIAREIILNAQHDLKLLEFKPSIIAASALLYAINDFSPIRFASFRNAICDCSYVDKEEFTKCYDMMQDVAKEGYDPVWFKASNSCDPANALDLNYLSSSDSGSDSDSSSDSENNAGEN